MYQKSIRYILRTFIIFLSANSLALGMLDNVEEVYQQGLRYRNGKVPGFPENSPTAIAEAEKLFLEAAEKGHSKAMHNLGVINYKRNDYKNAYDWFKSAGENGLDASIRNIKRMMLNQRIYEKIIDCVPNFTCLSFNKHNEILPIDILNHIFSFLDPKDLIKVSQACLRWKIIADDPRLWRALGLREYGGYLSEEDLRQNPRRKVIVQNLLLNLLTPDELTKAKEEEPLRTLNSQTDESINKVIVRKLQSYDPCLLCSSERIFFTPEWVQKLNDSLVARQNKDAIKRKIEWLTWGRVKYKGRGVLEHPYKKDYELAKKFKKILERL